MQQRETLDAVELAVVATRSLAEASTVVEAMPPILRALGERTGWITGAFWMVDRSAGVLRCERVWHGGEGAEIAEFEAATLRMTFGRGVGLPGRVWATTSEHWISDITRDENFPRRAVAEKCGLRTAVAFPIFVGREVAAVLELFSDQIRTPDDRLLDLLGSIATQLGQFMERKRAEDTTHFLSEASAVLAGSLDYRATLERLVRVAVPFLCDWCAIDVVSNGVFERVGVAHVDPSKASLVRETQAKYPQPLDGLYGYPKVLRTGISDFFPEVTDDQLVANAFDPEHLRMLRELGYRSFMCVALVARGRTLGTMTLVNADPGRRAFRESDLRVAEDLARRAALAVDNALLFEEAENARRRAHLLADASRLLVETLDHREALAKLAEHLVPELGDLCIIHLVGDDGNPRPTAVGVAHADPPRRKAVAELLNKWPVPPEGAPGINTAVRTGQPQLFRVVTKESLEELLGAFPDYHAFIRDVFAPRSTLIVPATAHGKVVGTLTLSWTREGKRYCDRDLPLARDLADRVALAVSNSRLFQRAEAAVGARDEFLSIASHELRTPLTALQLVVRMLRTEASGPAKAQNLEIAERQVARMTKLISTLFDISRVTSGGLALELEEVDLASVARDVVERFGDEAREAGCAIEVRAGTVVGRWDRFRLEQVVTNLLANAVKFGRGKPIHVEVHATERGARLVVRDHGIGIPEAMLPRLFQRFTRVEGPRRYDGLGLGLYIVRQILDALGGEISVDSLPGEGATFRVDLPLAPGTWPRDPSKGSGR